MNEQEKAAAGAAALKYNELPKDAQELWEDAQALAMFFGYTTDDANHEVLIYLFAGHLRVLHTEASRMRAQIADLSDRLDQTQRELNARDDAKAHPCAHGPNTLVHSPRLNDGGDWECERCGVFLASGVRGG